MADPFYFNFAEDFEAYKDLGTATNPVAVFHGLGSACSEEGMISFTNYLKKQLGVYVRCVEIGNGANSSFLMSIAAQADEACKKIQADSNFSGGLNVVGLSQGGLIARSIAQNCSGVTVHVINTVGTPNNGVSTIPNCFTGFTCKIYNDAVNLGVYTSLAQSLGPAGYFKDQYNYDTYLKASSFLASFNNERSISQDYINIYQNLKYLVMVKFTEDTVVDPPESEWFGYYQMNSEVVLPYNETIDYTQNYLGFKELDQEGKIARIQITGNHLKFTQQQFTELVIPYLL